MAMASFSHEGRACCGAAAYRREINSIGQSLYPLKTHLEAMAMFFPLFSRDHIYRSYCHQLTI
ncbi:hypothetical protein E2562_015092 [Oryza meyeriana var. granulata]|uniref:Uncharacterized protein n=1 Tax=Oryza meyeriana var. granulata TaxID=110450 RepID=A0A6G1DWC0_9ORYZ|nr:hypothetical protein E2562_015092 [Oryza meyeriana var. granulata]